MNILDKELLTFSNATNLDWHFADLSQKLKNGKLENPTIQDLLTPESFVRKDSENSEEVEYIYCDTKLSKNENLTPKQIAQGLQQMRQSAGVLMNYLEECDKNSKEGNFIKEWEVVYAGDNYKIYADYINRLVTISKRNIKYPTREEVEKSEKINFYIDVILNTTNTALAIYGGYSSLGAPTTEVIRHLKSEVGKEILNNLSDVATSDIPILSHINELRKNLDDTPAYFGEAIKMIATASTSNNHVEEHYIKLTQSINFNKTSSFKVLVLKKKSTKDIVIAINNKGKSFGQSLPVEVDLLQIVLDKIKKEYSDYKINFTGYNNGADFCLLGSLLYKNSGKSSLFYTNSISGIKQLIDFTPEDINANYSSSYELAISNGQETFKEIGTASLFYILSGASFFSLAVLAGVSCLKQVVTILFQLTYNASIKNHYKRLIELKYIKARHLGIIGYIEDRIFEKDYYGMLTKANNSIKVDTGDALFLLLTKNVKGAYMKIDIHLDTQILPDDYKYIREKEYEPVYLAFAGLIESKNSVVPVYYRLVKGANGIYRVRGIYNAIKNQALYSYVVGMSDADRKKLKQSQYTVLGMKAVGKLQREWLKYSNIKNIEYIYPRNDKIIRTLENKGDIPNYYNTTSAKRYLNEHIFLPYIQEGGDLGQELNKDYIKNALKDAIHTVIENKDYAFCNKTDIKPQVYNAFLRFENLRKKSLESNSSGYGIKTEILPIYYYPAIKDKEKNNQFSDCYKVDKSDKSKTKLLFNFENSQMKYGFNSSTSLSRNTYELLFNNVLSGLKFSEILNIILPPKRPSYDSKDKKYYVTCDVKALDMHIKATSNNRKLKYNEKLVSYGYVNLVEENKEFRQNYYTNENENKFGSASREERHFGVTFSYGRENPICCSHPSVYSPVKGKITEAINGYVIIENTDINKSFNGKEMVVPYRHIIGNLHSIKVTKGSLVAQGDEIGTMGGTDSKSKNPYHYLQHVYYAIEMDTKYFTGQVVHSSKNTIPHNSTQKTFIDPCSFWDKGIEKGWTDFSKKSKGGIK